MNRPPSIPETEREDSSSGSHKTPDTDAFPGRQKDGKVYNLAIKTISWPPEGRGLLHVLSPMLFCKDFKIRAASGSYYLARSETSMEVLPDTAGLQEGNLSMMARIDVLGSGVTLDATSDESDLNDPRANEVWEEVPKDSVGRQIYAGDTLRFGSYKVKVVEIVLDSHSSPASDPLSPLHPFGQGFDGASEAASSHAGSEGGTGPTCRICFEPASSEEPSNRLVSPCLCSGSLRYIHVNCLRRWLDGQLQVRQFENGGGSYFIRTIHCEICKSEYSHSIYRSILIPRPSGPHILLEDLLEVSPQDGPTSKMHVIPIKPDKPIRLGRSKENDVVLSDISVSRVHGLLTLSSEGKCVRLIDLQSKFGSLVQMPSRVFLPIHSPPLRVQVGSSLIEIAISFPNRVEKIVPERFLQHRGSIRVVKSHAPSDNIIDAEKSRRATRVSSEGSPLSPAATLDQSGIRSSRESPGLGRQESS